MRYIDFTAQTLLILFGLGILAATWHEHGWPGQIIIAQTLLGPWQVLSSIIGVLARRKAHKLKRVHLIASVLYFLVMILAKEVASALHYNWSDGIMMCYLVIPPWILAFYYYRITWRIAFPTYKKNSNFLPHINF